MRLWKTVLKYWNQAPVTSALPVTPHISACEQNGNIRTLTGDELEIYNWLKEGYSIRWTAETLMRSKVELQMAAKLIYQKLGVANQRELIRYYGDLDRRVETDIWVLRQREALFEQYNLDRREREAAALLLAGKPKKDIMTAVYAIRPDADARFTDLLRKLNIHSRTELYGMFADITSLKRTF
ncbi:hypothetical protein FACS18947_5200 [Bacteroidia bacterium]|nr:hypothetical protein FACS18947_5200 [Bacteroidia bacterium]